MDIFKNNKILVLFRKHIEASNKDVGIERLSNHRVSTLNGDKNRLLIRIAELEATNKNMNTVVASLENCIKERTKTIQALNKKLDIYAFSNSHKVRAPLARVLGLAKLLQIDAIGKDEKADVNKKILRAAEELEIVISNITKSLEKEVYSH